jgi:hypothetical protein
MTKEIREQNEEVLLEREQAKAREVRRTRTRARSTIAVTVNQLDLRDQCRLHSPGRFKLGGNWRGCWRRGGSMQRSGLKRLRCVGETWTHHCVGLA